MLTRLAALLVALFVMVAAAASAQPVRTGHLEAQLVRQTQWAAPGSTVYLAMVQDIDPDWHTYWINPGDVGQATQLDWTPPPGVEIGTPIWPVPQRILTVAGDDRFSSYAYEGRVVTPVPIAVPAFAQVGTSLAVRVEATFFVCSDTLCIPETARLSVELPIREGRPGLDSVGGAWSTAPWPPPPKPRPSSVTSRPPAPWSASPSPARNWKDWTPMGPISCRIGPASSTRQRSNGSSGDDAVWS